MARCQSRIIDNVETRRHPPTYGHRGIHIRALVEGKERDRRTAQVEYGETTKKRSLQGCRGDLEHVRQYITAEASKGRARAFPDGGGDSGTSGLAGTPFFTKGI